MGDGKRTTIPRRHHMASLRLIVGGRRAKEILPRYKDILNCPLAYSREGEWQSPVRRWASFCVSTAAVEAISAFN